MSDISPGQCNHGVRVVRQDEIARGGAGELVAQLVAALTHAPTGVETLAARSIELAPGACLPVCQRRTDDSLVCVISGEAAIHWGEALEHTVTAGPGDLLIIPAGVTHQAHNPGPKRCQIYFLENKSDTF
ncbi:MAG: cupin domain-containing protein [Gammaproteobacteria bacterium]|nr:cupin domain-containing protein [Gammaproteobacteria bacterium]